MNLRGLLRRIVRPRSSGESGLSKSIDANVAILRTALSDPKDLYVRDLILGDKPTTRFSLVYLRSMSDLQVVRESVTEPLTNRIAKRFSGVSGDALLERIRMTLPTTRGIEVTRTSKDAVTAVLEGRAIGLVEGATCALSIGVARTTARAFQQPTSEISVLGPQVALSDSVEESIALIRTRIRTSDLKVERMIIGRKSRTEVRLLWVEGIAPPEIVSEVRKRLQSIDTDMILDPGMIRNLIEDRPFTPFVQGRLSERPDSVSVELSHGATAVLVDGSPFALLQPSQFLTIFEAPEDYYNNSWASTMLRMVRMLAYAMSTLATPVYVAVVTFHHELIPLPLLLNIASTQEGVPFPLALAAFGTEIILEVVREAGVRLPQQFGPAVSIVGALVLGQSAIQAGFVPPGLVIVVMFATIASFAIPRYDKAITFRIIRFPLLFLASTLGLVGLTLGSLAIVYHLASLKTLGVPYLSLYTPGHVARLMRKVIVAPPQLQPKTRPLGHRDRISQGPAPQPKDPKLYPRPGDSRDG
jgi:spore germination protein KA